LIGHVFFNAPLAARVFLGSLATVPGEHWRLAAQLGMRPASIFRVLDWPVLKREAPALAALIFLLCFTSFAIVLALGGGPGTATLEVAIYGAVRFDVDFARAGLLALLQIAICAAITLPLVLWARRPAETAIVGTTWQRPDAEEPRLRTLDYAVLVASALFIIPPLAAVAASGVLTIASLFRAEVGRAIATSFAIALPGSAIALVLALAFAISARNLRASGRTILASTLVAPAGLTLALPPVAVSAGLFVVLRHWADPFALAIPLIVLVNALTALPFVLRQLEPPLALSAERYGRLAESLGVSGFWRLRLIDWPMLRRPFAAAFATAAALSLGDLGVAAFFGSGSILTLPLLIYQRMGSYRMAESASVALLLSLIVLLFFLAAQKWSGDTLARSR
jgi:thiamine transport system permease protein